MIRFPYDRQATRYRVRRGERATRRLKRFFEEYTDGFTTEELRRLVGRDARQAYHVITREQDLSAEPRGRLRRWLFRAKITFLGLSAKLTPARRVLFGVAIAAAVLGALQIRFVVEEAQVSVNPSPALLLLSVVILVFLLALELVDRVLVRDELEVARQLQRDLLPSSVPPIAGYDVAHSYRTANEIGGDYYDFLPLSGGRVALVVGDASGHGMAAGLLMAIANAALKLAVEVDPSPARVAELLNRVLYRTGDARSFLTLFYAVLDPPTGALDFACVGHPFPLLRRANGEVVELGTGGFPLGIRERLDIAQHQISLAPGDLLLLYSDGLPEAVNPAGEAFGYDAMRALVRQPGGVREVHDRFLRALTAHVGGEPLKDDVTLVAVARM